MKKRLRLLRDVIIWIDDNKKVIGVVFAALVTLIGVDTATVTPLIPPSVTPGVVEDIINAGPTATDEGGVSE